MYHREQTACWLPRKNSWANIHFVQTKKYGLKIFWACKYNTGYGLNAIAYGGKESNRVHHNLTQDIVLKVVEPWYGTGKDICTDNCFTSCTLANQLLQENLTLLRTVCRHRRKVPIGFRQKANCTETNLFLITVMGYVWWLTKPNKTKTQ